MEKKWAQGDQSLKKHLVIKFASYTSDFTLKIIPKLTIDIKRRVKVILTLSLSLSLSLSLEMTCFLLKLYSFPNKLY
jgi:hypothetical protein